MERHARLLPRAERVVVDPSGREWQVRLVYFQRPDPPVRRRGDETYADKIRFVPYVGPLAAALIRGMQLLVVPSVEARLRGRPWIEARTVHPPTTMVWRSTGEVEPTLVVDQIAGGLADGTERPLTHAATWVGYT